MHYLNKTILCDLKYKFIFKITTYCIKHNLTNFLNFFFFVISMVLKYYLLLFYLCILLNQNL